MTSTIKIGEWCFAADTGMLENGDDVRRLEHRAAALLSLLVSNADRVTSHAEIVETVWAGRSVSANSVAVVISDIRRSLGDDSREPTFIETLPKRGYRLIADVSIEADCTKPHMKDDHQAGDADDPIVSPARRSPLLLRLAAAFGAVALLVSLFAMRSAGQQTMVVSVAGVVNKTGDTKYDPLTTSVSELVTFELGRHDIFNISTPTRARVIVSGNLIMWDGHPAMSLHAQSASTGDTLWTGMASGPESALPRQVREQLSEFAALLRERG